MGTADTFDSGRSHSKNHYVVLDGLRGVASLVVVIFHLFEAFSGGDPTRQIINHGYLAVDFFFLLSGFVIAYAYDDRWGGMQVGEFIKRRLVRLQPMIVVGSLIGAALWAFQDYSIYPILKEASLWHVILIMVIGFTMIPLPPSADIRGWTEMYPLNGPAWSLFYEYVANLLYALGVRKLSNSALGALVTISGAGLIAFLLLGNRGDLIGGWTLDQYHITLGVTRVMFPFFAGVLLMRLGKRIRLNNAFLIASLLLLLVLAMPRLGGTEASWLNGLYEAFCVIVMFPLIVAIGAGDKSADGIATEASGFFGALSYPLYITHYPLMYIYTGWVVDNNVSAERGAIVGAAVLGASVLVAWASLKLIDEPARRWLGKRLLGQ